MLTKKQRDWLNHFERTRFSEKIDGKKIDLVLNLFTNSQGF